MNRPPILGNWADDTLIGGSDDDHINGSSGNDLITGGDGDDLLDGENGRDTLVGGNGQDTLIGGGNSDRLEGGLGDDTYHIHYQYDPAWGGWEVEGEDVIQDAGGEDRVVIGEFASDVTSVEQLESDLFLVIKGKMLTIKNYFEQGENGGHIEAITFSDGTVWDLDDVRAVIGQSSWIRGTTGDDTIHGGSGDDRINGEQGDDILIGADGSDHLIGAVGNDTLAGSAGNDTLLGGGGSDQLEGGSGDDIYHWHPNPPIPTIPYDEEGMTRSSTRPETIHSSSRRWR